MNAKFVRLSRRSALAAGFVLAITGITSAVPVSADPAAAPAAVAKPGVVLDANSPTAVPDSYIAVLADSNASADVVKRRSEETRQKYGVSITQTYYSALRGFAVKATADQAARLATDPVFEYVTADQEVTTDALAVQASPPSWGINRIDERSLPLDTKYHYANTASTVTAYIIDTGIRYTHQEFGGRAIYGIDVVGGVFPPGNDCYGHGTHVAGTVGGKTVGVAKDVQLVSVRVLNCSGSGTLAGVIAGVDWVTNDTIINGRKSVANMSLGAAGVWPTLNTAVGNSVAANVHYSVSAGNGATLACNQSPASAPAATTVGSTETNDARSTFSNYGSCVDIFAPGRQIYSALNTSDTAYGLKDGTSMAAPHVTGTAALWRHKFPTNTAWQTAAALTDNATPGVVGGAGAGSPNKLLFSGFVPA
ncbi:S8 family peptidase [Actinokineospora sp. NBRC 105648]|uniref:S8 family peptidase n=1 Tax=Actinokineospora sp. NBRC 105648 TaxID=3032206 RepID=UPI0024A29CC3|nr:S8 family peptidase [Actinokineospora sp. NBRC 105648]GLZ39053.1 serine protease [Actinokineospora sp. NBRC 105648]